MEKPDVKIIENQEEQLSQAPVSSWEVEQLLRKYGYTNTENQQYVEMDSGNDSGLTFEEMVAQENQKRQSNNNKRHKREDNYNQYVRYSNDEDTGFEFKIEIVTDMKIPD